MKINKEESLFKSSITFSSLPQFDIQILQLSQQSIIQYKNINENRVWHLPKNKVTSDSLNMIIWKDFSNK